MLVVIAIVLPILIASGFVAARTRRTTQRCRQYLATIELWQPGADMAIREALSRS